MFRDQFMQGSFFTRPVDGVVDVIKNYNKMLIENDWMNIHPSLNNINKNTWLNPETLGVDLPKILKLTEDELYDKGEEYAIKLNRTAERVFLNFSTFLADLSHDQKIAYKTSAQDFYFFDKYMNKPQSNIAKELLDQWQIIYKERQDLIFDPRAKLSLDKFEAINEKYRTFAADNELGYK